MKIVVMYDSAYGNTAKVAQEIARTAGRYGEVVEKQASNSVANDFKDADVLFIGSPTQGGRPTELLQTVVSKYAHLLPSGAQVAPFDTRFSPEAVGGWLRLLMRVIGYAAPKIASSFRKNPHCVVEAPEGFIVTDREGPLLQGELDRAANWARQILNVSRVQEANR